MNWGTFWIDTERIIIGNDVTNEWKHYQDSSYSKNTERKKIHCKIRFEKTNRDRTCKSLILSMWILANRWNTHTESDEQEETRKAISHFCKTLGKFCDRKKNIIIASFVYESQGDIAEI